MDKQLEYRWATPDDEEGIEHFLAATFGPDSVQSLPGRMRWLYFENPHGLHISLCLHQGEIVACCGHLPQPVTIAGKEVLAGFGVDFMVAERWRRQGLGKNLLDLRLQRFDLSLSIGQSAGMSALYDSHGSVDLGPMLRGIHRKSFAPGTNLRKTSRNFLAWLKGQQGIKPGTNDHLKSISLQDAVDWPPEVPDAQQRWAVWRFSGPVYNDYCAQELSTGGRSGGFIIWRKDGETHSVVHLASGMTQRPSLLAAAGRLGPSPETAILFTGDKLVRDCTIAGYLIRPHGARLIAHTRHKEIRERLVPGCLDLMSSSSDADLVRHPTPNQPDTVTS